MSTILVLSLKKNAITLGIFFSKQNLVSYSFKAKAQQESGRTACATRLSGHKVQK